MNNTNNDDQSIRSELELVQEEVEEIEAVEEQIKRQEKIEKVLTITNINPYLALQSMAIKLMHVFEKNEIHNNLLKDNSEILPLKTDNISDMINILKFISMLCLNLITELEKADSPAIRISIQHTIDEIERNLEDLQRCEI